MAYRERLLDRRPTPGRPVRVGLVGAGQMGRGFVAQVRKIAGMEVVAVADIDLQRATGALKSAGIENVITGDDHDKLTNVVAEGGTIAVTDATRSPPCPSTWSSTPPASRRSSRPIRPGASSPASTSGAQRRGRRHRRPLLSRIADQSGGVYSVCRGDEPAEAPSS